MTVCYSCKQIVPRCDIHPCGWHDGCGGIVLYAGQDGEKRRDEINVAAAKREKIIGELQAESIWIHR